MPNSKISALTSATTPLAGTETLPIVQSSTTKQVSVANLTAGRAITCTDVVASGELVSTTNNARISLYRSAGINYFDWSSGQTLAFGTQTTQGGAGRVNKVNFTDAGNIEIANGNLVQGTAAKGVNFTANTPAAGMTSQLLNWYEEGTWTPTYITTGGSFTYSLQAGRYTRIGRRVFLNFSLSTSSATVGSGDVQIGGLPFAINGLIQARSSSAIGYSDGFVTNNPNGILIIEGASVVYLQFKAAANGGSANLQSSSLNAGSGNTLFASFEYDAA